jgi:putative restriction endonuclease
MKEGQRLWTREELILAINLYCKLPFGKLHSRNADIINLANIIDRTPSSVALKLVNFASLDPSIIASGRKGAVNSSKLDKEIWSEFYNDWDSLSFESEKLLASRKGQSLEEILQINEEEILKDGKTRDQIVKARVNQSFFRSTVLAAYNNTCCITGLQIPELLVAGHIVPWATDEKNRLNPRNGILLNTLHDRAFENGLLTITPDYKVRISSELKKSNNKGVLNEYFLKYDGKGIIKPTRFLPDVVFLEWHAMKWLKR